MPVHPRRKVYAATLPTEGLAEFVAQLVEFVRGVDTYSHDGPKIAIAFYDDEFPGVRLLEGAGFVEHPPESDPYEVVYGKRG